MTESARAGEGRPPAALPGDSTLRGVRTSDKGRLGRWARWGAIAVLVGVVGLAASGRLGVRTDTVSTSGDGLRLTVDYAAVARAGLDVPLRVQVDRTDGSDFDDDITLEFNAGYLSMFETQGFLPDPDQSAAVGDDVRMTFNQPPEGSSFVLNYDAYIEPASQIGTDGRISVIVDDAPVASVEFHTTLLP
jgi:hypothetical protein